MIAAAIVATVTTVLAFSSMRGSEVAKTLGVGASAVVDALLFIMVGFGIWRYSRVAAVSGLLLFIAERLFLWATARHRPGGLAVLLLLGFVNGVRGTFAYHRFTTTSSDQLHGSVSPS